MPVNILGISAYYHDSAAALVRDGEIVAAAQEEGFTRKKHDPGFPGNAVAFCLKQGGLRMDEVDLVAFYEKPFLKFERLLETYLSYAPVGFRSFIKAMPMWIKQKLWMKNLIQEELNYQGRILFPEHHESHAASAFYPSPYQEAAVLTLDGVGEWTTTSIGLGQGNKLELISDIRFPHSLGLLYSAFTYYTGFKVNSGEYKVMGLAPYGEPKYRDLILQELVDVKEDGSFRLNMEYFNYAAGLTMTNERFHKLFGAPRRQPETQLTQREMDLARSVQEVTEEIVLRMARHVRKTTGMRYLTLAGGVALNCVANGKLLRENLFDGIFIQPAAGDAGGALGCALLAHYQVEGNPRQADNQQDAMQGSLLGPGYSNGEIQQFLESRNLNYTHLADEQALVDRVADLLAAENVVGWFQGRKEYGPRALGARSILGDPRSPKMQEVMNLKIKFRESFRPFAPSVLRERVNDYFDLDTDSPYMLLVAPVKAERRIAMSLDDQQKFGIDKLNVQRSDIPAVTHVDYSARVQTVDGRYNPRYYRLLQAFEQRHGSPVVVNTSFNVRGEPIVSSPEDAYRCFMRTEMDYLVLGNYLLAKSEQQSLQEDSNWKEEFVLD